MRVHVSSILGRCVLFGCGLFGCGDKSGASDTASDTAASVATTGDTPTTGGAGGDAVLLATCEFNDGPGVDIRLAVEAATCAADWGGERLRVVLFQAAPLGVGEHAVDAGSGFATLQVDGEAELMATAGSVTIAAWAGDAVSGSYTLTFPGDVTRTGEFVGVACAGSGGC